MLLRRSIILALGSMPLLARLALSQTAVKAPRVGLLSSGAPFTDTSEIVIGLTAGFSKRGYVVGSSLLFDRRAAEAHPDRLPGLVDDLKTHSELIITNAYAAARVVKDRSNVPVVAITGADPGLIDSLARPGGHHQRRDFTEKDRIAVPTLKVAAQTILMHIAAKQVWGMGNHTKLDHLFVALPNPRRNGGGSAGWTRGQHQFCHLAISRDRDEGWPQQL